MRASQDLFFAVPRKYMDMAMRAADWARCEYAEALPECHNVTHTKHTHTHTYTIHIHTNTGRQAGRQAGRI